MPKVWQNAMFFGLLGLASSEKQIPQVDENTEESKSLLEPLESVGRRPRQARYQAALRPDGKHFTDCKVHGSPAASPRLHLGSNRPNRNRVSCREASSRARKSARDRAANRYSAGNQGNLGKRPTDDETTNRFF